MMNETDALTPAMGWLLNYLMHSTILLGLAWLAQRRVKAIATQEFLWRLALVGSLFSATVLSLAPTGQWRSLAWSPSATETTAPASDKAGHPNLSNHLDQPRAERTQMAPIGGANEASSNPLRSPPADGRTFSTRALGLELLLSAWLAGILLCLWRLGRGAWLIWRHWDLRELPASHPLQAELRRLATSAGLRRVPRLCVSQCLNGPVSLWPDKIGLPSWSLEQLSVEHLRAVMAHEVAHLRRGDVGWRLFTTMLGLTFIFQPLHWLAGKRLAALAELACDEWAARQCGQGRALAESLAACAARLQRRSPAPVFSIAMAGPRSLIVQRVERLMNIMRIEHHEISWRGRLCAVGALLLTLFMLPVVNHGRPQAAQAAERHVQVIEDDEGDTQLSISVSHSDFRLKAKGEGRFHFNDEEDDITAMSDGSYFELMLSRGGDERQVSYRSRGGNIERRYYVEGREREFDAGARAWLAGALAVFLRESGFDAEARVERILRRAGPQGVLDEIHQIGSNYVRRVYITSLAASGPLPSPVVDELIRASAKIDSDYELRTALTGIDQHQQLRGDQLTLLLESAVGIDSDYEARVVLESVAAEMPLDAPALAAYMELATSIGSDYETRVALVSLLQRQGLPTDALAQVIRAIATIGSDYEQRQVLEAVAPWIDGDAELIAAYRKVASGLGRYEREQAENALLN